MNDKRKPSTKGKKSPKPPETILGTFGGFVRYSLLASAALFVTAISLIAIMFAFFWRGPADCEQDYDRLDYISAVEMEVSTFASTVESEGELIQAAILSSPEDIADHQAALLDHADKTIKLLEKLTKRINGRNWDIPSILGQEEERITVNLTRIHNQHQRRIYAAFEGIRRNQLNNQDAFREQFIWVLRSWVGYIRAVERLKSFLKEREDHDSCKIIYASKVLVPSEYNDKKSR